MNVRPSVMLRYWPLLVPLVFGLIVVMSATAAVSHPQTGTDLESALLGLSLGGMLYSLVAFPATTILLMVLVRRSPVSFASYAVMLFIATLPVAYFQAVNMQSSLMILAWHWLVQAPTRAGTVGMNMATYIFLFTLFSVVTYLPIRKRPSPISPYSS